MERIFVEGNDFVTESGEVMIFRGVNIADPDRLEKDGDWDKQIFIRARDWGANIIRIPVHPGRFRERGAEKYMLLMDEAVSWAKELGLYLIIDWHSIGNLSDEMFQHPMYVTSMQETCDFWEMISLKYAKEPVVAMYELYNEPAVSGPRFGDLTWQEWKGMNEEIIDIIRVNNPGVVILVAGFNWAYDLRPVASEPIERSGIAYVSHPYPQKRQQPWEEKWEDDWGFVSEKYPVILTEIGFATPDEKGVHVPVSGDESYGNAIVDFCDKKGISWVAWCFDPKWSPTMITDWNYTPSRQGVFFREAMTRLNN